MYKQSQDCCEWSLGRKPTKEGPRLRMQMTDSLSAEKKKRNRAQTTETKVILLGESGVGKTSIAERFCRNHFIGESHIVTIGAAYMQQTVTLPNESRVKMHIWDTGGSERFRTMVNLYYREAQAAIVVYDVCDFRSINAVQYWVEQMEQNATAETFVLALVGNKIDMLADGRTSVLA